MFVELDLPGVDPASIDVTVERGVLTVSADRAARHAQGGQVLFAERPHGRFARRVALGSDLDVDAIEARYAHGVLMLRIPVPEEARPRRISIGSGNDATAISADAQ